MCRTCVIPMQTIYTTSIRPLVILVHIANTHTYAMHVLRLYNAGVMCNASLHMYCNACVMFNACAYLHTVCIVDVVAHLIFYYSRCDTKA